MSIVSDFLKAERSPAVLPDNMDFSGPDRFINRELSWLAFNWRVLEEAQNPNVPLLERLRFLSISDTNLDEFYTVRVAGLRELADAGNATPAADGLSPVQQLVLINDDARNLLAKQQVVWSGLKSELSSAGIRLETRDTLSKADRKHLQTIFLRHVFPILSPLAIDPAHPFPFIANEGYSLALELSRNSDKRPLRALLPIPHQIDRFVPLPSSSGHRFLPLEELLLLHLDQLFPGY
ncbi:MAG: RNA degradosome polyphosphate kinase, partial [Pseudomonadota bacterium]